MRVLLCVSDFPYSAATITFARQLLQPIQAHITLLTVRPNGEDAHIGEKVIEMAEDILRDFRVTSMIRQGKPATEILAEARKGGYSLIVVGARDQPTLGDRILGSVTRKVVGKVPTSILTVRQPPKQIRKMMICTSGQRVSDATVKAGAHLAKAIQAAVFLLHVTAFTPMMFSGLMRLEEGLANLFLVETPLARRLRRNCLLLNELGLEAHLELRHGVPSEEILLAAKQNEIDLLVIGRHPFRPGRLLMDDVGLEILDYAATPVLVVRSNLAEHLTNS